VLNRDFLKKHQLSADDYLEVFRRHFTGKTSVSHDRK
jgi:hypothetical protein